MLDKKSTLILTLLLGFIVSLLPANVKAHPVAFKGSTSIMGWSSAKSTEFVLGHSFTSYASFGVRALRLETRDDERTYYIPQFGFLLKRWNELESQANVYFVIGHGGEIKNRSFKDTSSLKFETDWESRKYYISFAQSALIDHKHSNRNIYHSKLRAGFAPYLAEFNELNSWFILEANHMNKGMSDFEITPLIRLFYKNILIESGSSFKGDLQFNFMVHY